MFLIYGLHGIIGDHTHDSGWMFFARIVDNLMHIIGQLHSNMASQFSFKNSLQNCYY
jgi:hypothetical protein